MEFTQRREPKGELCLVVGGCQAGVVSGGAKRSSVGLQPSVVKAALVQMLAEGDSVSHAARRLAEALGVSRNALYDLAREAEAKLLASERH